MILHSLVHAAPYVLGGAGLGLGYQRLVGCRTGLCPLTSNPYVATLYGAFMGFVASGGLGR